MARMVCPDDRSTALDVRRGPRHYRLEPGGDAVEVDQRDVATLEAAGALPAPDGSPDDGADETTPARKRTGKRA